MGSDDVVLFGLAYLFNMGMGLLIALGGLIVVGVITYKIVKKVRRGHEVGVR